MEDVLRFGGRRTDTSPWVERRGGAGPRGHGASERGLAGRRGRAGGATARPLAQDAGARVHDGWDPGGAGIRAGEWSLARPRRGAPARA